MKKKRKKDNYNLDNENEKDNNPVISEAINKIELMNYVRVMNVHKVSLLDRLLNNNNLKESLKNTILEKKNILKKD